VVLTKVCGPAITTVCPGIVVTTVKYVVEVAFGAALGMTRIIVDGGDVIVVVKTAVTVVPGCVIIIVLPEITPGG